MKIAFCDDSSEFLEQLQSRLQTWTKRPQDLRAAFFTDREALLQTHTQAPFDVIVLDVVMPLHNGIELAKAIRQLDKTVKLVFITGSAEFAVDAFAVKASNYLLKPLDPRKLYSCLEELYAELQETARRITVKSVNAMHRIAMADIEYIEAQNKRILFVLTGGRSVLSTEPLYTYEDKLTLEDGFFKCSRSFIVNIHRIDTYAGKEIRMRSGARIPISRRSQQEFENAYFTVLFGKAGGEL